MKNIKNLNIKTLEGINVRNLERGWSIEWGPEGSLSADIYLNNEYIGHIHQSGEGGCACFSGYNINGYKKLAEAGISFLKRTDKNYSPGTKYTWLQNKTAKTFQDDDIEAIVIDIEERYDDIQAAKKHFKSGYKALAIMSNDFEKRYLCYKVADVSVEEVRAHMRQRNLDTKYPEVKIISCASDLNVL